MTFYPSSSRQALDIAQIQSDFPALQLNIRGKRLVYLDNAASAQKPLAVIDAISNSYAGEYANVHRGLHYLSSLATERYEELRETARSFLNASTVDEIVFTRNATEAINLVSYAYAAPRLDAGDEIILSLLEHHSNIVPWHFLRERQGAVLKWIPLSPEGDILLDEFRKLLGSKTRLVAITHMSNVLGSVTPVKEIISLAHEYGIPVLVDGSQFVPHFETDVRDLDADFYVFTGHKIYGPTAIGILYGKKELLNSMRPFNGGGEMITDVTRDSVIYAQTPKRFEAGTPPIVQAVGLKAALDYVTGLDRSLIMEHEMAVLRYAHENLSRINGLRILGNPARKGAIISFYLEQVHPHDLATFLDHEGIAVRSGSHCAMPLLSSYGLTSVCRASFALYNDFRDVDSLVNAIEKAKKFFIQGK